MLFKCGENSVRSHTAKINFADKQKVSQTYEREKRKRDFQEESKKAGKMAGSGLSIVM